MLFPFLDFSLPIFTHIFSINITRRINPFNIIAMKLTTSALALSWVSLVTANFDIYLGVEHIYFDAIRTPILQIFDADPDCDNVEGAYQYVGQGGSDVSNTIGYRCSGDCGGRADGIDQLEMHFSREPYYHFSKWRYAILSVTFVLLTNRF